MTPYSTIYKKFLNKISDVKLLELSDEDIQDMLHEWLTSAVAKFRKCENDLSDRDEILESFNADLLDIEIEILATLMVEEWLEPQLNSTLLTSQVFGSKEEKWYSQANQIEQLIALSKKNELKAQKLSRDYDYQSYVSENLE